MKKKYNNARELCCKLRFAKSELERMFSDGKLDDSTLEKFSDRFYMPDGITPHEAYQWIATLLDADISHAFLLGQIEDRNSERSVGNELMRDLYLGTTANEIIDILKSV